MKSKSRKKREGLGERKGESSKVKEEWKVTEDRNIGR